ncbi:MAG TPA: hypothetical protein VGN15_13150 [Ktedonobacteraceae bacterium]|nr:hypothetical protein [Ktedonobacteraceae bacterium]
MKGVAMLQSSSPQSTQQTSSAQSTQEEESPQQVASVRTERPARTILTDKRLTILLIAMVVIETFLVTLALVPAQLWTRVLPTVTSAALDGPFPPVIAPIITALLYIVPAIIGFLSRGWQRALLFATLPAWIGLGLFLIAATFKVGAFYLVSVDHVTANVSVLELFAALGAIGWLGRTIFKRK